MAFLIMAFRAVSLLIFVAFSGIGFAQDAKAAPFDAHLTCKRNGKVLYEGQGRIESFSEEMYEFKIRIRPFEVVVRSEPAMAGKCNYWVYAISKTKWEPDSECAIDPYVGEVYPPYHNSVCTLRRGHNTLVAGFAPSTLSIRCDAHSSLVQTYDSTEAMFRRSGTYKPSRFPITFPNIGPVAIPGEYLENCVFRSW